MTAPVETSIDEALAPMQALASRLWSPSSRHHPGQLAWSARYALPEDLDHGPVALVHDPDGHLAGWAWAEASDWLELCVDPARPGVLDQLAGWFLDRAGARTVRTMALDSEQHVVAGLADAGFVEEEGPWFTHHLLDLDRLPPVPEPDGYTVRSVGRDEAKERSACHRAAWSPPGGRSRVSAAAYARLMETAPYRSDLDRVALDEAGGMVASCLAWLDEDRGVALLEPVGCHPDHRGRGLATAVSLSALHAARSAGARTGLVCPRGDDDHPAPRRLYQAMGFVPGARTRTLRRDP